ncbi:MAG: cupredoxin domain-containing protein [Rhodopseudomonas sp.]|uniref:cupredoxin domain-containing protein n=1 Tax=Rhodopseudomonas sp. TaxID=1078 RepID=UPI00183520E2|nr:cupredoxin domain-containing protein [Rhodopseudomonas sp.]NVN88693.1 cupredoxin domain-containing protein [Rhodopseudomonas sp.]
MIDFNDGCRTARLTRRSALLLGAAVVSLALTAAARAEDDPTFRIEFRDGKVTPQRLEVPANRRIKLELYNLGNEPAEFESKELRKEKVLAPGASSTLVIRTLDPGEYDFFDDFHLDAPPAVLVAK